MSSIVCAEVRAMASGTLAAESPAAEAVATQLAT